MLTIELRFLSHRFHATPWGRHVNEGVPEWPPAPYRLVRALYDAWKRKHPGLEAAEVADILGALASEPPFFDLPAAAASHTRSYLSSNTEDPADKSLIFDAFVALHPDAACFVTWKNASLTIRQRQVLQTLLGSLNYVGRSESWVEARICDTAGSARLRCEPLNGATVRGEMVPVACPVPPAEYHEKRPWLEALTYSTTEMLKDRRSGPPALRMVPYVRPEGALAAYVPQSIHAKRQPVHALIISLDAKVRPLAIATIEIAEQIRRRLMAIHQRLAGGPEMVSPLFSGKTEDGCPREGHQHLFILPLANAQGRIDRVLLYTRSKAGFSEPEIQAVLRMRSLREWDEKDPIRCIVTWKGAAGEAPGQRPATLVSSTTPFVTLRHWRKGRGSPADFLEAEVRRECRNHALPEPLAVEPLPKGTGVFEWVEFRRNRRDDLPRPGYGFRLRFPTPVPAPFSLGYGCHFGLGQFDGSETA